MVSILTGFSFSVPLFAFLFYMDDKRSRKDKSFQNLIIKKLELLKLEVAPYEASMLSSLCASGLSYFITNLASKALKDSGQRNKITRTMTRISSFPPNTEIRRSDKKIKIWFLTAGEFAYHLQHLRVDSMSPIYANFLIS